MIPLHKVEQPKKIIKGVRSHVSAHSCEGGQRLEEGAGDVLLLELHPDTGVFNL